MKTVFSLVTGLIRKYGELRLNKDGFVTYTCDVKTINKIAQEVQEVVLTEFTNQMIDLAKTLNTK